MRTTIDDRQSNTMPNKFEKRVRSFLRNRFKCLPWILCARECPTFLCVLNRDTNTTCSTGHDTGTTASPHCILLARQLTMPACSYVPTKIEHKHVDRNCPTSVRNTKHCIEPWRNDISNLFPLARSFHTVLTSSAASEPQSHGAFWAVASCSVPRSCRRDVMALCTSSQRSVCNSELKQSSLVLTLCHINLRTTRAQFPRHRHV